VTTSLTNFDVHDLARAAMTYGLAGFHVVTPIAAQRDKAEHIVRAWTESRDLGSIEDEPESSRAAALALVRIAASIDDVLAELPGALVVATSARADSFPRAERRTPDQLLAEASAHAGPLVILLGTGHGLVDDAIPAASRVLAPIDGPAEWNHLSVRSAGAVMLDRLFGRTA